MVYRRQQRRGTDTQMHPTYEKILSTAIDVLIEQGFDRFNVNDVLERAEVSRGTLYHHFGDVDALIESALAASYGGELLTNHQAILELVERCKTPTEFRRELQRLLGRLVALSSGVRLRRVHTIALCQTRPDLAEAVRSEQDAVTQAWVDLIERGQEKGFVRRDVDPRVGAAVIQGVGISRIVEDVATDPLNDAAWAKLTFDIMDAMLFVKG